MKSWIVLFVISAAAIEVLGYDNRKDIATCIKESNADIQALRDDKHVEPSDDPAVKCFYACMAKRKGWMSESGDIIPDKFFNIPFSEFSEKERSVIEPVFQLCVKNGENGKNDCETAYIIQACFQTKVGLRVERKSL